MPELLILFALSFSPDGCTLFPEGTPSKPSLWAHCCLEHDLFYWAGGSHQQRLKADRNLHQCVAETGHPALARLIYASVRLGRFSPVKFDSQRWGNAWGRKTPYRALSEEQITLIIEKLEYHPQVTEDFIYKLIESLSCDGKICI